MVRRKIAELRRETSTSNLTAASSLNG